MTVGTQLPFDRLVRGVDEWAADRGRTDVFAQIGDAEYRPRHVEYERFVSPKEFRSRLEGCSAIVSHAGMGTILMALDLGKPILVLPRRVALREMRNDHQIHTARRLTERGWIQAAMSERELPERLDAFQRQRGRPAVDPGERRALVARIGTYVLGSPAVGRGCR